MKMSNKNHHYHQQQHLHYNIIFSTFLTLSQINTTFKQLFYTSQLLPTQSTIAKMVSFTITLAAAITTFACMQMAHAGPVAPLIPILTGAIAGGKRDLGMQIRGEQPLLNRDVAAEFAGCMKAIKGKKPKIETKTAQDITIKGLPTACITDANKYIKAGKVTEGKMTIVGADGIRLQGASKQTVDALDGDNTPAGAPAAAPKTGAAGAPKPAQGGAKAAAPKAAAPKKGPKA